MVSLVAISPGPGEKLVALDSPIEFTLTKGNVDINISTLIVEVNGSRAISDSEFKPGYNGIGSLITPVGNDFVVVIDPESNFSIGKVYNIKVQVQDFDGKYLNRTYSFRTVLDEPVLIASSPSNNDELTSPQIIYLEFEDTIEGINKDSITVSLNNVDYVKNGLATANVNGPLTDVSIVGTTSLVRIDPIKVLKDGAVNLKYSVSDNVGNSLNSGFKFIVNLKDKVLPSLFSQTGFLGFFQGIERVSDLGNGNSVFVEWNKPVKKSYKDDVFVLVYQDSFRLNVFDNPTYLSLSTSSNASITGLTTGESLSFGARALEVGAGVFDVNGMEVVDGGVYRLPATTTVMSHVGQESLSITVSSANGYPDAGLLLVGMEVIRYESIDRLSNTFIIPANGRGLLNSVPGIYISGDPIKLFLECTDNNTVIVMSTPTYQDGYGLDRVINGEGLVVTDYSDNDRVVFQGFDFCGWHDPQPEETLTGKNGADCGSYQGGEYNGWRGFNLYDRMLGREEVLLGVTGEPVILLKRIWDGVTCSCMDSRKLSPKIKSCGICYGTGYVGGFTQFYNPRRIDKRLLVSFSESSEDLSFGEKSNLQQEFEPNAWTLANPAVRDRDLILRFDYTNDIEFIYEVLKVNREKILNRRFGRQTLSLKRLDKTDINYTFPFDLSKIV